MKSQEEIQKALFVISEALGFEPVDLDKKDKEPELLPCPFCGHRYITLNKPTSPMYIGFMNYYIVQCCNCLAMGFNKDKDVAISLWNTRTKSV
jgi:Lar family restriction alleviation protein